MPNSLLSQVRIGTTTYDIKDADSRAKLVTLLGSHAVEALGNAAWANIATEVKAGATGVADVQGVKAYVDAQVGAIHKFDVVVADELPMAGEDTMYKIYLIPDGQSKVGNVKAEYITVRTGAGTEESPYAYNWEKIGTTETDLSEYVKKTTTVAGIDLQDNIGVTELQDALGLEDMAYADAAIGTVPGQTITGVKATGAAGAVSGTVTLNAFTQTATEYIIPNAQKADYTPAGTITGSAINGGSIEVTVKDAANKTEAELDTETYTPAGTVTGTVSVPTAASLSAAGADESGHVITGTVSKPGINLTSADQDILSGVTSAGQVATWTGADYTAPSLGDAETDSFAIEGMTAAMGTGTDSEVLIFTVAEKKSAVTDRGTFNAGNVDFGTFNGGSMPTFATGSVKNVTAAELAATPVFTGEKVKIGLTNGNADINAAFSATNSAEIVNKVEYYKQEIDQAEFTGTNATLGFSGTKAEKLVPTAITYDKATANGATFAGNAVELNVGDIVVTEKTVTVTPVED